MDNIFLIRDDIDACRSTNVNCGIVSWDQEKAFDKVDHSDLFSALRVFDIGDGFLSWVGTLYNGEDGGRAESANPCAARDKTG